jgi:sigma-B regulation protein RsbU (phosphoserine phosphatase)
MPDEIRTLIIDDSQADIDYVRSILKKAGPEHSFRVTWESDPKRALGRLAQEPFDLVLLDYHMPAMSGLDVLARIREAHRLLPVIMLTGMGNEQVAVEAMKRGAHDYLRKDQMSVPELTRAVIAALERKRLEDELAERRRALEQDLRMARELQQAFLPQSFPHFAPQQPPDAAGIRFYHRYTPTLAVGGDFFDVLPINEHSVGVFVSDVAGHGMQAALVTAVLRTLIEELKDEAGEADRFLGHVNAGLNRILRQMTTPIFATAFYLKVDLDTKRATFSNAGHPPQLHLRRKHGEVARLYDPSKTGPVLGLAEDAVFPSRMVNVDDEDVFLLFTDGIVEVPNDAGEPFGIARVEAAAKQALTAPPAKLIDHVVGAASQHAGANIFPDDVCIVALEAASLLVRAAR